MEMSSLSLGILVPSAEAGKLIGKQGSGLKQVRDMSQCKVNLSQEVDSQGNRRCDINGPTVEHIASAIHASGTRLFDQARPNEKVSLLVAFPNEYVGRVIGKGGQNLKDIVNQTGVELQLGKEALTDQGDRAGQLTGIPNQLGAAIRIALNAVSTLQPAPMSDYGRPMQSMQPMNNWRPQHGGNPAAPRGPMGPSGHAQPHGPIGHAPMTLTQVRPASGNPNEVQIHVVIPPRFIGCILGKEGAQIKQLLADTGCAHLAVSKKDPFDSERRVIIVGGFEECVKAQNAVWQIYSETAQQAGVEAVFNCMLMVPIDKAGAVIGKEGSNLKQIREKFGVKVQLAKEHCEGFRPCTLSGTLEMVLESQREILDQMAAAVVSGGGGNGMERGMKRPLEAPNEGLVPAAYAHAYAYDAAEPQAQRLKASPPEGYTKLLVPANTAGAIIGKSGNTLKQIRESTGAGVDVLPAAQTPEFQNLRVVILRGDFEIRQAALVKVLSTAFEKSESPVLKMMVPKQSAGAIIGKAAANIKAIRESSGISVQVDKTEVNGERMVDAAGSLEQILNVATMIMESLQAPSGKPME